MVETIYVVRKIAYFNNLMHLPFAICIIKYTTNYARVYILFTYISRGVG